MFSQTLGLISKITGSIVERLDSYLTVGVHVEVTYYFTAAIYNLLRLLI